MWRRRKKDLDWPSYRLTVGEPAEKEVKLKLILEWSFKKKAWKKIHIYCLNSCYWTYCERSIHACVAVHKKKNLPIFHQMTSRSSAQRSSKYLGEILSHMTWDKVTWLFDYFFFIVVYARCLIKYIVFTYSILQYILNSSHLGFPSIIALVKNQY